MLQHWVGGRDLIYFCKVGHSRIFRNFSRTRLGLNNVRYVRYYRCNLEILHQCGERVKTKSQKVLEANSYVCRNYRGKTGSGAFLAHPTSWIGLGAKITLKTGNFYFTQILTGIVEKQHEVTTFIFFKSLHYLTLFPTFLVYVNWIWFYVTTHLSTFYYRQILCNICHVVTKAVHEVIIMNESGKLW